MKNFLLICVIINGSFFSSFAITDEVYQKILSGHYVDKIDEIASEVDINDATELFSIADESTLSEDSRSTSVILLRTMKDVRLLQDFKILAEENQNKTFRFLEKNGMKLSEGFFSDLHIRNLAFRSIGMLGTDETNNYLSEYLKNFTVPEILEQKIEKDFIDDIYVLPIAFAIGDGSLQHLEFLKILNDFVEGCREPLKRNIKIVITECKEKFYNKNPDKIPGKGYEIDQSYEPELAIFYTQMCIERYYKKNKSLPSSLLAMTISNGGDVYFFNGDKYNLESEGLLYYKWVEGELNGRANWTYLLLSLGPNKKLDANPEILKPGMRDASAFKDIGDDILNVVTYYSTR